MLWTSEAPDIPAEEVDSRHSLGDDTVEFALLDPDLDDLDFVIGQRRVGGRDRGGDEAGGVGRRGRCDVCKGEPVSSEMK